MERIGPFKTISSWEQFIQIEKEFGDSEEEWVFRGEAKWRTPKTSLQRVCEEFDIGGRDVPRLEARLIDDFRRNYGIYARSSSPKDDDLIYWLSVMRHYGAPTRLLDFTYSFFIASFFALEGPPEQVDEVQASGNPARYQPSAVWAISKTWLTEKSTRLMDSIGGIKLCNAWGHRKGWAFRKIFWNQQPARRIVFAVNPSRSHERLHLQQGLFLCPGDVVGSFEENLLASRPYRKHVRLILIDGACRQEVLWKLHEAGLNRELLFPGLDGFAKSLCTAGPLLFLKQQRLAKTGGRIPIDSHGNFRWSSFLRSLKRKSGQD